MMGRLPSTAALPSASAQMAPFAALATARSRPLPWARHLTMGRELVRATVCQPRRIHGEAIAALISTHEVMIDNGPSFRRRVLLCSSRNVIRLCSQQPRAGRDMYAPTGSILDGVQAVPSILQIVFACLRIVTHRETVATAYKFQCGRG